MSAANDLVQWHSLSTNEVAARLATRLDGGLSAAEAGERLAHRDPRRRELAGQLGLRREPVALPELAGGDPRAEALLDPVVERGEVGGAPSGLHNRLDI